MATFYQVDSAAHEARASGGFYASGAWWNVSITGSPILAPDYATRADVWKSTDDGQTWTKIAGSSSNRPRANETTFPWFYDAVANQVVFAYFLADWNGSTYGADHGKAEIAVFDVASETWQSRGSVGVGQFDGGSAVARGSAAVARTTDGATLFFYTWDPASAGSGYNSQVYAARYAGGWSSADTLISGSSHSNSSGLVSDAVQHSCFGVAVNGTNVQLAYAELRNTSAASFYDFSYIHTKTISSALSVGADYGFLTGSVVRAAPANLSPLSWDGSTYLGAYSSATSSAVYVLRGSGASWAIETISTGLGNPFPAAAFQEAGTDYVASHDNTAYPSEIWVFTRAVGGVWSGALKLTLNTDMLTADDSFAQSLWPVATAGSGVGVLFSSGSVDALFYAPEAIFAMLLPAGPGNGGPRNRYRPM